MTRIGLGTTIWSPLASGLLTGKYNDGIPQDSRATLPGYEWLRDIIAGPKGRRRVEQGEGAGQDRRRGGDADPPPGAAVVPGQPARVDGDPWRLAAGAVADNLTALDHKAKLTPDVMAAIEDVVQNKPEAPQRF